MIELANKKRAVNMKPYAHRLGGDVPCTVKGCDKTATHMCVTPGKYTHSKKPKCWRHTIGWIRRTRANLHDMGCVWNYAGMTERAKQRATNAK